MSFPFGLWILIGKYEPHRFQEPHPIIWPMRVALWLQDIFSCQMPEKNTMVAPRARTPFSPYYGCTALPMADRWFPKDRSPDQVTARALTGKCTQTLHGIAPQGKDSNHHPLPEIPKSAHTRPGPAPRLLGSSGHWTEKGREGRARKEGQREPLRQEKEE